MLYKLDPERLNAQSANFIIFMININHLVGQK
jgi:hypothetical protein